MEKVTVVVSKVRVIASEDKKKVDVRVEINKEITGFALNEDTNEREEKLVKHFKMPRAAMSEQLCSLDEDIEWFRAGLDHSLGQAELGKILLKARLEIGRTKIEEGETYQAGDEEKTADRAFYKTDILSVNLHPRAKALLDTAIAL